MINAVHTVVYTKEAEALRAFFRDVLRFPFVDAGNGRLFFALPPGEMGVHSTNSDSQDGRHQLYFQCDDVESTMEELKKKGVEFTQPVKDVGWGLLTAFRIPGGELYLYEPKHASPLK